MVDQVFEILKLRVCGNQRLLKVPQWANKQLKSKYFRVTVEENGTLLYKPVLWED